MSSHDSVLLITVALLLPLSMTLMMAVFASRYKKAAPNKALIIYGRKTQGGGNYRVIIGGGHFVQPIIESFGYLYLEPVNVSVQARADVRVSAVVQPSRDDEALRRAASSILDKSSREVSEIAATILEGAVQKVLANAGTGSTRLELAKKIAERSRPHLDRLGLEFVGTPVIQDAWASEPTC